MKQMKKRQQIDLCQDGVGFNNWTLTRLWHPVDYSIFRQADDVLYYPMKNYMLKNFIKKC